MAKNSINATTGIRQLKFILNAGMNAKKIGKKIEAIIICIAKKKSNYCLKNNVYIP